MIFFAEHFWFVHDLMRLLQRIESIYFPIYWWDLLLLFFLFNCENLYGIPEFLDFGCNSWTLDSGCWTLDFGLWTLDSGLWTLDSERWILNPGRWTLDSGCWTLDCGKLWKQWSYINNFIFEFYIDKNLCSFQSWKFIYVLLISGHSF